MPHTLNIDGVSESLFVIQSLAHGSRSFCETHHIKWADETERDYDWNYYFGWLKSLICEHLIKSSITLRMIQDIVSARGQEDLDLAAIEAESVAGLTLGIVHQGGFALTLRQSFNKIIHATDTQLEWQDTEDAEFWTGRIILTGNFKSSEWRLELDTLSFCTAAKRFVDNLAGQVDWHRLYKYDR